MQKRFSKEIAKEHSCASILSVLINFFLYFNYNFVNETVFVSKSWNCFFWNCSVKNETSDKCWLFVLVRVRKLRKDIFRALKAGEIRAADGIRSAWPRISVNSDPKKVGRDDCASLSLTRIFFRVTKAARDRATTRKRKVSTPDAFTR